LNIFRDMNDYFMSYVPNGEECLQRLICAIHRMETGFEHSSILPKAFVHLMT
ncbi:hypothetical protein L9F63_024054, partial [Diploptera punctata]